MKVLFLSRYGNLGASSRYRSYQYLPYLSEQGFDISVASLMDNAYLQRLYSRKPTLPLPIIHSYWRRVYLLIRSHRYDLIYLEKEAFPWVPAWLEGLFFKSGVPYVVDYDDALFHRYDRHTSSLVKQLLGQKIDRVMHRAKLVIAGNNYLAERAKRAGAKRVEILPTVVNLELYPPAPICKNPVFTIGWIGSPVTSRYLTEIYFALREVCKDRTARVVAIGAGPLELKDLPLEIKPWSEATEVKEMQQFDVGIMPLPDSPWERGKCGFKLIQYMACARPVIASPVGVNCKIVDHQINGFCASSTEEWIQAFQVLKNDWVLRQRMGEAGRVKVEAKYCLNVTAPQLSQLLREAKE
ncbi:glycosyltransferase family 4 protein [Chroococcidiopsis sp. CCMEE 29]|uniref:glycosyltransferase family 4 protein n=1 Tax=Chroococcidiopsis sp. CCMEE 29 TaxID=155894 RepID=UPI0020212041|nr:glycosyltransferase family 4 protein [Chroococcidiopsis sp. CCMEE 29]